ncbi:GDSL-like Lipase/Acylhydrolase family protein [Bacteroidetes bacterium oral taxon 272 str. F0290]|nr:GDSL-like Lipase/Acylhydrolase family protein [Bacteroidetes bacterium oral taxon 272 str. F0290]
MKKLLLPFLLATACWVSPLSAQTKWVNPLEQGAKTVHGRWWPTELKSTYHRMPERAEKEVRKDVWDLSKESAGLSIVFRTDATDIKVRYKVSGNRQMVHMPATGVSGVDLYATDANGKRYWCANRFHWNWRGDTIGYHFEDLTFRTPVRSGYEFHLYLPLYNEVTWLEIGVPEEHFIRFTPSSEEKPIVVYGTSIAQGACASRPGMAWTNIVERETEHPLINLAFSGNGRLEEEVFRYLSEIDSKLYIIDCLPNMTDKNLRPLICDRTLKGIDILRAKNKTPILLVEHNYANRESSDTAKEQDEQTNKELRKAYEMLQTKGVKDVYYLSREDFDFSFDSMVEGIHPNDLGMRQYADAYIRKIQEIFREDDENRTIFKPCTQQRDFYDWKERHNLTIARNREQAPQIVLIGNSITHFWSDDHRKTGKAKKAFAKSWDKLFEGKIVRNQGYGWDRIENGLWRIYHGELDDFEAEKIFLLLGANNVALNTDEEIVDGMLQLIRAVKQRQPNAKIYQVGIMPERHHEQRIARINRTLQEKLQNTAVTYVDMSTGFLDENGKLIESLFIGDGVHPNAKGYEREAKNLEPYVKE